MGDWGERERAGWRVWDLGTALGQKTRVGDGGERERAGWRVWDLGTAFLRRGVKTAVLRDEGKRTDTSDKFTMLQLDVSIGNHTVSSSIWN